MEQLYSCTICGGTSLTKHLYCKDNVASGEYFKVDKCSDCGFVFTNPRPPENDCGRYYKSENYVSHSDSKWSPVLILYRMVRWLNLSWKLKIINNLAGNRKQILDYGCGLGTFLNHCKQNGWQTTGMDISEDARKVVKERFDIDVYPNNDLFKVKSDSYQIITLWHVLEHVYRLDETLAGFHNALSSDGYLLLALPNCNSYDAKKYQENWDAYDVPRHIHHFTPASIQKLLVKNGFAPAGMYPMKYDAYYVSIRSEWHSGNNLLGIIKGLWYGFVSNNKSPSNQNHSSMLYLFKKAE